jgi:hypothetical protein
MAGDRAAFVGRFELQKVERSPRRLLNALATALRLCRLIFAPSAIGCHRLQAKPIHVGV